MTGLQGSLALVEVGRSSACDGCRAQGSCVTSLEEKRPERTLARNTAGAGPGDTVEVSLPESVVLWGALTVYMLPLAVMFVFVILAGHFKASLAPSWPPAAFEAAGGVIGLLAGLALVRLVSRQWKTLTTRPEITRIISRAQ